MRPRAQAAPTVPQPPARRKRPIGRYITGIVVAVIVVVALASIGSTAKQCSSLFGSIEENTYDWSRLTTDGDIKSYTSGTGQKAKLGVDVSEHNGGNIDWDQIAQSGVEFAYVRVGYRGYTEGFIQTDAQASRNIMGAKAAGIDPAVYIFSQAITVDEAREEADYACDAMETYGLSKEYPVAFDMEENNVENERIDGLSAEELTEIALAFCDRVRERGYTPIVYGNDKWLNGYFDLSKLAGEELLWLAEYDDQPSVSYNFKIWQYTSTADLPGSGGNLDMDLMFPDN
ncbi:MAG: glycoside hydrolase family 25 protein [Coriobacteriales bacterium]|jgi:lysozyme